LALNSCITSPPPFIQQLFLFYLWWNFFASWWFFLGEKIEKHENSRKNFKGGHSFKNIKMC
jgi:hypothetical protein